MNRQIKYKIDWCSDSSQSSVIIDSFFTNMIDVDVKNYTH